MLSACSSQQPLVIEQRQHVTPPAEAMVKGADVPVFYGSTVYDLVDYCLDLLNQYNELQIRHNTLVDWVNKDK